MPAKHVHSFENENGDEVKYELEQQTGPESAIFEVWVEDGREWRVEVSSSEIEVLESRRDGRAATLETPEWLRDWASELRHR